MREALKLAGENKELMRKYFEETLGKGKENKHEFLKEWFSKTSLEFPSGMELEYVWFDGDYYRCEIFSYEDMFYMLVDRSNQHVGYYGELTSFVKEESDKLNISVEEFISRYFPLEVAYTLDNFEQSLEVRNAGTVEFPKSKKQISYFYDTHSNDNDYKVYSSNNSLTATMILQTKNKEEALAKFFEILDAELAANVGEPISFR